ncbi:MAG: LPS export ABC transporter permease LptF [Alphaproteobacteria bacterium HGW-Alphaproteobacteria-3]|nr:MAG: LPS export ABC transporter permease LptF [Alphaproteobacteria bacterium HGW-Alphaproteobacteria-3]
MLTSLSRYIFLQALGPFIVASIVLTGIIWLTQALRMLDVLITQGQTLLTFFELTSLALPSTLVIVLPISIFCAMLYTLHKLIGDSEIVVMFSAGVSRSTIATPLLAIALVTSVLILLFSIYLAPAGLRQLKSRLYEIRSDVATAMIREGSFINPAQGLTVYVRERTPDGTTYGILVHDSRNPEEPITYMAETGSLVEGPQGPLLVMFNGNIQRVSRKGNRNVGAATLLYFDKYTYDLSQYMDGTPNYAYEGRERYFGELIDPASDDTYALAHVPKLRAEAHERLVEGIYPTLLTLIALAALLPAPFNRRGYASRLTLAAVIALAVRLLGFVLSNGSATENHLIPLMYLFPLSVCGICVAIIAGVRFDLMLQRLMAAVPGARQ